MGLFDRFKRQNHNQLLKQARELLDPESADALEYAIKNNLATLKQEHQSVAGTHISVLSAKGDISDEINTQLKTHAYKTAYEHIAPHALETIAASIAPHIYDLKAIKQAVALQLASAQRIHILLLGDPGTGKTDILRSASQLITPAIFGLGSGTSNAGLSLAMVKGELHEGLLVQAHKGLCCIDELNLLKKTDRGALYNAMEKGFVTYSKAGKDAKAEADVMILATANPIGDAFESTDKAQVRKQLPFDEALMSRFHLTFIIHRPDEETFAKIATQVVRQEQEPIDTEFIRAYIADARTRKAKLSKAQEKQLVAAASAMRAEEKNAYFEITPRAVKALRELTLASARLHHRSAANEDDVTHAVKMMRASRGLTT